MHLTLGRIIILVCVLLVLGGVLWIALVSLMAWAILRPPRMSAGKAMYHLRRLSPGDLGLGFEEENFKVRDVKTGRPLHIAGWWIPSPTPSDRCCLLVHGYADAKVGAIAWPLFHHLKFNILAIDLRAHGDSQGRFSTGGFFERDDISQVIDQIMSERRSETSQMVIFGISLGAAVAIAVASQRHDITGLILESPFPDYRQAIAAHARLTGLPHGFFLNNAIGLAQVVSSARFDAVQPLKLLEQVRCPVLCIVGREDDLLDEVDFLTMQQAVDRLPRSSFWLVEQAAHLQAMAVDPLKYQQKLLDFITRTFEHDNAETQKA